MNKNFPENLTRAQTDLNSRIFDLILGRVLKRAYLDFDKKIKQSVKELTDSGKNPSTRLRASKKPAKKYMPDLKILFKEEAKKIEKEIEAEIEKQL